MEVPMLLYHHVVPDASRSDLRPFIIDEADFRWQLQVLEEVGLQPVTLRELVATGDSRNKVVLTFDDCPRNLLDHALPWLEERRWKAVFFAPCAYLGDYNAWNVRKGKTRTELMTEAELRQLHALGHEIGAHSMTHPHLDMCSSAEAAYEVTASKQHLERVLGDPVTSFAYPYGDLPADYRELMSGAGYRCAVAMESDAPTIASDPYRIARTVVETGETRAGFRGKVMVGDG